jgi:hypothetical protein
MSIEFNLKRKLKEARTIEEFRTLGTNMTVVRRWICLISAKTTGQNGGTTKFYNSRSR